LDASYKVLRARHRRIYDPKYNEEKLKEFIATKIISSLLDYFRNETLNSIKKLNVNLPQMSPRLNTATPERTNINITYIKNHIKDVYDTIKQLKEGNLDEIYFIISRYKYMTISKEELSEILSLLVVDPIKLIYYQHNKYMINELILNDL
jgi:hypothetical protein